MKRGWKIAGGVFLVSLIAIQFVPVQRTSLPGVGDPDAPRQVQWILRRACYDCHSTESRWPIWAYVAPASWLVIRDVNRARGVLDLSAWPKYSPERQAVLKAMIGALSAATGCRCGTT